MSLTSDSAAIELVAGTEVLPVASLGTEAIVLKGRLGQAAAQLELFTLSVVQGASRIRVPFRGAVEPHGGEIVIAPDDRAMVAAAATGGFDPGALRALVTAAEPADAPRRRATRARALALVTCALLGTYVGARLWDKITGITPRVAYLATDATTLLSPTSGRVTFVEALGAVEAGQPAVGIETTSGNSLLIDAPGSVDIVAAEKQVGERVKRGDPLLAYALPDAGLYLHAVVDRDQAFRITTGTRIRYARLDASSAPVVIDLPASELEIRALPADRGTELYEVRIPVLAGDEQFRALPVQLRFEQDPVAAIGHALSALGLPLPFAHSSGAAR
jgi:hypothetical protein